METSTERVGRTAWRKRILHSGFTALSSGWKSPILQPRRRHRALDNSLQCSPTLRRTGSEATGCAGRALSSRTFRKSSKNRKPGAPPGTPSERKSSKMVIAELTEDALRSFTEGGKGTCEG